MNSSQTLLPHQLFSDSATQYFCWLHVPREHTTIRARASKEMDRVDHTNRLQHPGGIIGPPRTLILIVKRSRSQLFLSIRFGGARALTETIRWTPIKIRMESGGLHASIEGIITFRFTVEPVALPNLRQTLRGRERSKRGYALYGYGLLQHLRRQRRGDLTSVLRCRVWCTDVSHTCSGSRYSTTSMPALA